MGFFSICSRVTMETHDTLVSLYSMNILKSLDEFPEITDNIITEQNEILTAFLKENSFRFFPSWFRVL